MYKFFKSIFASKESRTVALNQSTDFLINMSLFKWAVIVIGVNGVGFLLYWSTANENDVASAFSRKLSRMSGQMAVTNIPNILRKPLFNVYSNIYNVNFEDMIEQNFENYNNFQEFFTRKVKPRQFSFNANELIVPADSKVLSFTEIKDNQTLLVKNINYELGHFLTGKQNYIINKDVLNVMKKQQDKDSSKLYSIIFYLAPGDYHRYHSPSDFRIKSRNHIAGFLQPVKVDLVEKQPGIYETNERVGVFGTYPNGFLGMVFVGALNVGSMTLNFDQELMTNQQTIRQPYEYKFYGVKNDMVDTHQQNEGIILKKGDEMGMFKLGSTIVMIFEAKNVEWKVKEGDKVRWGESFAVVS